MNKTNATQLDDLDYICNLINKIYPLILITFGTIGNSFILYIFTRNQFIEQSTCFYFAFSAVIDTFLLYFGLLKHFLRAILGEDLRDFSDFNCKFFIYSVYFLQQLSAWTLILISLDRLIITFPSKFSKSLTARKCQYLLILFLLFLFIISNIHIIINVRLHNGVCYSEKEYYIALNTVDLFVSVLIPFVVMFSSSLILLVKIYKSKSKVFDRRKSFMKTSSYAIVIIGKNFSFILLNIPLCIMLIKINVNDNPKTSLDDLLLSLSNLLNYLNLSFNFFLFFTINGIFRKRFLKIFTKLSSISSVNYT